MTLAATFESLRELIPGWLYGTFNPNDNTNLAPYRALHFVILALLVARFLPKDWKGLKWAIFDPLINCGQQSLRVFCVSRCWSVRPELQLCAPSPTTVIGRSGPTK